MMHYDIMCSVIWCCKLKAVELQKLGNCDIKKQLQFLQFSPHVIER
jgi:hypothetical protein